MQRRSRGFTLVELLVVIGIVVILLSILIPVVSGARRQVRNVGCLSNLKQLSTAMTAYCAGNERRCFIYSSVAPADLWIRILKPYGNIDRIRFCPEAADASGAQGSAFSSWTWKTGEGGSYALNGWLYETKGPAPAGVTPPSYFYHVYNADNPRSVPTFIDAVWVDAWPRETDTVPANLYTGGFTAGPSNNMGRVCIARHDNLRINLAYLDCHVETIGLEELWAQKWHAGWVNPITMPTVP